MEKIVHLLRTACAFLVAIALTFGAFNSNALAAGGFSLSCTNAKIDGSVLSASCKKLSGANQPTSIDLNQHVQNANGNLSWGGNAFSLTCTSIELSGSKTLKAECKKVDGVTSNGTSINLDEHIANIDGTLKYES